METQSRFDLNQALAAWRQELASQSAICLEQARELEAHLLDALSDLEQRGLSEEEAFWLARRRLGRPEDLAGDFSKANPAAVWRERVFWLALGALTIHYGLVALNYLSFFLMRLTGGGVSSTILNVYFYGSIAAVAFALWRLSHSNPAPLRGWFAKLVKTRTQIALCIGGLVLVLNLATALSFWQSLKTFALYQSATIDVFNSVLHTAVMNLALPVVLAVFVVRLAPLRPAKN